MTAKTYPHAQAAFINAIREEGTKAQACDYLQEQWNETCTLRAEIKQLTTQRDSHLDSRENLQGLYTAQKTEIERLLHALGSIGRQELTSENDEEGDFEYAYDILIKLARAALEGLPK